MRLTSRLVLALTLPPLLWAGNAVVGRLVVGSVPPLWLNAVRWAIALALLAPLGWRVLSTPAQRQRLKRRAPHLAVLGLTGVGAYNALQYLALTTSTPLNVTLIAASSPLWMLAVGALWHGVQPQRRQLAGAALSLAGVLVVLTRGRWAALGELHLVAGDLWMLVAVASWAAYSWMLVRPPARMAEQAGDPPPWTWAEFLCVQMAVGLLWASAAAGLEAALSPAPTPIRWTAGLVAALAYISIFPSLVSYRLWGLGVAEAGPAVAAFFANLTPLFAALLSAAMLGEWPQGYHAAAFALIVGGIVLSARRG